MVEAEPLRRRSVEARERTLGAGHADTLASDNNSAWLLRAMDAEQLAKVLALSKETDKDVPFEALLFAGMSNGCRQRIIEEIDVEKADCLDP